MSVSRTRIFEHLMSSVATQDFGTSTPATLSGRITRSSWCVEKENVLQT